MLTRDKNGVSTAKETLKVGVIFDTGSERRMKWYEKSAPPVFDINTLPCVNGFRRRVCGSLYTSHDD